MNIQMGSSNECPKSSPTETDFDVLKNDLFKGATGMRVDSFLKKHLTFTMGRLIGKRSKEVREELFGADQSKDEEFQNSELAEFSAQKTECNAGKSQNTANNNKYDLCKKADMVKDIQEEDLDTSIESLSISVENAVSLNSSGVLNESAQVYDFDEKFDKYENCDGVNEDGPHKPRKMHRCQSSILNACQGRDTNVPVMKNGHISTIGAPSIVISSTCAFDVLFDFYAVAYCDIPHIKTQIDLNTDADSVSTLIRNLFTDKETKLLNQRNILLRKLYDGSEHLKKVTSRQTTINCNSTLNYVFQKMGESEKVFNSACQYYSCHNCKWQDETMFQCFPHCGLMLI